MHAIGKLDQRRAGRQAIRQALAHKRWRRGTGKFSSGRPETMAAKGSRVTRPQGAGQVEGIALDHLHAVKARRDGGGEIGIIFDQPSAARARCRAPASAAVITPVPGPSSSTGPGRAGSIWRGDGARQRPAGWRHRADILGPGDQGAQEAQIVGERVGSSCHGPLAC